MRLRYNRFEGIAPKVDDAGLGEGLAAEAVNAGFSRGFLSAVTVSLSEIAFSDLKPNVQGSTSQVDGIFYSHMADAWFLWPAGQEVIRGVDSLIAPLDEWNRIYFADQNGPRYMTSDQYNNNSVNIDRTSYRLGVPAPDDPTGTPMATKDSEDLPGDVDEDDVVRQRVAYVYTLLDDYGHEGPPSFPSNVIELPVEYDATVTVSLPTGNTDLSGRPFGSNARKYIYRTTEGTEGSGAQYIGQVALSTTDFTDTVAYGEEGEAILSLDWDPPPSDITEIEAVASNFLSGIYDNMVCHSVPKLPHAWPLDYRFPLRYQTVRIQSTANGLFVGTTGKPYWCFGSDPEAAIPVELNENYPCVGPDSVVDVEGVVAYASYDGLVAVDGQSVTLVTEENFHRNDWIALGPATMKAFTYGGRYIFACPEVDEIYALELDNPRSLTRLELSDDALMDHLLNDFSTMEYSLYEDRTVLSFASSVAPTLVEVTSNEADATVWESRKELSPPMVFHFLRVYATAEAYPVMVRVRSENNADLVTTVQDDQLIRLPRASRARWWSVQVEFDGDTGGIVREVAIAQSSRELA